MPTPNSDSHWSSFTLVFLVPLSSLAEYLEIHFDDLNYLDCGNLDEQHSRRLIDWQFCLPLFIFQVQRQSLHVAELVLLAGVACVHVVSRSPKLGNSVR